MLITDDLVKVLYSLFYFLCSYVVKKEKHQHIASVFLIYISFRLFD